MSAITSALQPVTVPSFLAVSVTSAIWSRPWWLLDMCSERVSTYFTGRLSFLASARTSTSSPYSWSLAPKPPPTSGATTRILSSGISRMPASRKRAMCGICVDEYSATLSPRVSPTQPRGSIGAPEMRWLGTRCLTTTSASASAAAKSPPATAQWWVALVPNSSHTSGEPSSSAFSGSTTAGSGSRSAITRSAASMAWPLLSASTTAIASPTCLTWLPDSGQFSGTLISTPGGSQAIGSGALIRSARSSLVNTATTPGMPRASSASIEVMLACASGERTTDMCSIPGRTMSSM